MQISHRLRIATHKALPLNTDQEIRILRAVRDRFRCPDQLIRYRLGGELSCDSGWFQLPSGSVCYGRAIDAFHRSEPAYSPLASKGVPDLCNQIVLPFDPDEVIDNIRLERYPGCRLAKIEALLKKSYYWLRPLTNRKLRSYVQKLRAVGGKKKRFPKWPVDTTVENICDALLMSAMKANGVESIPFIWFWPNGAQACVVMTHDVETSVGRDFCAELMAIDSSFGIRSSFQIVPEGRYSVSQSFLEGFRKRGFEICIQDLNHDGRLFDDLGEFRNRATLINRYAQEYGSRGFRSAVLYRKSEWLRYLKCAFDMSIPNVAHLDPQRGGCCTVTPYFIGNILEVPLTTLQDYTLFHVLNDRSLDLWCLQLELILAKNGIASFLVHPDYIIESDTREVYRRLLAMLNEVRARVPVWFALPGEIDAWWRARSRMSVVKSGHSWHITGAGAERAVLAFAKIVDGQLVYELRNAGQIYTNRGQEVPAMTQVTA